MPIRSHPNIVQPTIERRDRNFPNSRGEFLTHEEVGARIDQMFRK